MRTINLRKKKRKQYYRDTKSKKSGKRGMRSVQTGKFYPTKSYKDKQGRTVSETYLGKRTIPEGKHYRPFKKGERPGKTINGKWYPYSTEYLKKYGDDPRGLHEDMPSKEDFEGIAKEEEKARLKEKGVVPWEDKTLWQKAWSWTKGGPAAEKMRAEGKLMEGYAPAMGIRAADFGLLQNMLNARTGARGVGTITRTISAHEPMHTKFGGKKMIPRGVQRTQNVIKGKKTAFGSQRAKEASTEVDRWFAAGDQAKVRQVLTSTWKGKVTAKQGVGAGVVGAGAAVFGLKTLSETDVMMAWAASDNVISGTGYTARNIIAAVEEEAISKEDGLAYLEEQQAWVDLAQSSIKGSNKYNPQMWVTGGKNLAINAERGQMDMAIYRDRLENLDMEAVRQENEYWKKIREEKLAED